VTVNHIFGAKIDEQKMWFIPRKGNFYIYNATVFL